MNTPESLTTPFLVPGRTLPEWPSDRPLRAWQKAAAEAVFAHPEQSFLASATPAAGKTTFGLYIAHRMLSEGRVRRVVVVGPTTHICRQWAADAARYGIDLEPNRPNADGAEPPDRHGIAVTYQSIAAGPKRHALTVAERPTLLIADEPHHMGDEAAWGVKAQQAFGGAVFRLLLSGTPFRSDNAAIPWVTYDEEGISRADYTYGYAEALVDRVCRPITFLPYDGEMEWISDGRLRQADFDLALPAVEQARRLRTALDPAGEWMGAVLRDADAKLTEVRERDGHFDAGGLVIASNQTDARAIAGRLSSICGEAVDVVISDEPGASARIADFAAGERRWLVSVLMVSEGVDIPRLRVGVYATAARTELFFRQVVGRFIRRTPKPARQMSHLLLPADVRLKALAFAIEEERRHAIDLSPGLADEEEGEFDEPPREENESGNGFASLSSSQAELDDAILSETTMQLFATDDLLTPEGAEVEARERERERQRAEAERLKAAREAAELERAERAAAAVAGGTVPGESAYAARERLRAERRQLVSDVARRTGEEHRAIHARINRAAGIPSVSSATREQLERGNELLRRELR